MVIHREEGSCGNGTCSLHDYLVEERKEDRKKIAELYAFYDNLKDRIDARIQLCKTEIFNEIDTNIKNAMLKNKIWMLLTITTISSTIATILTTVVGIALKLYFNT